MNLNRRLKRLERRCLGQSQRRVPWFTETEDLEVEGEFLTWEEYERRFPEGRSRCAGPTPKAFRRATRETA